MKTIYTSLLVLSFFFISLQSCSTEDQAIFTNMDKSIQNEGYFPLAIDNNWVYDNWLVIINEDGSYRYTEKPIESEHPISNTKYISDDGTGNFRFDYGFIPIGIGKVLGGFFGNFKQITKIGGNYIKKNIIDTKSTDKNGNTKIDYLYELDDQIFLSDDLEPPVSSSTDQACQRNDTLAKYNLLEKGHLISTKKGSYGKEDHGIYFEYQVNSYAVETLPDGLPNCLTNNPGIDDHLKAYKNVLHTRDVVKILKLNAFSEGGIRLKMNAKVNIPAKSSQVKYRTLGETELSGDVFVTGYVNSSPIQSFIAATLLPCPSNPDEELGDVCERSQPLITDMKLDLLTCPVEGDLVIDEDYVDTIINLVSDQPLYTVDQYWAKGVGNIKNITSPSKFKAVIDLGGTKNTTLKTLDVKPSDPDCIDTPNTITISTKMKSLPSVGKMEIPFTLESRSYVQNLKKYKLRTTLN